MDGQCKTKPRMPNILNHRRLCCASLFEKTFTATMVSHIQFNQTGVDVSL
jgi:hypothetical protein